MQHEQVKFDSREISSIGLCIADNKEGEFGLDLRSINAVRDPEFD